jgi:FAD/FMN-containing dehydrogenase
MNCTSKETAKMPGRLMTTVPGTSPDWNNWSWNLVYEPVDGEAYYFKPTNLAELKSVVQEAVSQGVTLRVSGQRHSQPPLVVDDNRGASPSSVKTWLVDLACYADLGPGSDQRIVLGPGPNQVTANSGVREDELDAFLTANHLMLETVTAGGFFSLGGMTAVDVHGGTINAPIFAETVSAFTILCADGSAITISAQSPPEDGWSPLQFARVSLGGLGIITSVTVDVLSRPWATTLQGGTQRLGLGDQSAFVAEFQQLINAHTRLEVFFTPYATADVGFPLYTKNFLVLWWDVVDHPTPQTPNQPPNVPDACVLAGKNPPEYGAPYLAGLAQYGADIAQQAQYSTSPGNTPLGALEDGIYNPAIIAAVTFDVVEPEVSTATQSHSEMWLTGAVRVIFMSYYVPLPNLDAAGLGKAWDGLDVVSRIVLQDDNFHIAAPMEFRFVKGGNSALSGTFADDFANTWFVNLDVIGFVEKDLKASDYPPELLQFFADVEREWVAMGGFPHQGKMYGFYDPTAPTGSHTAPFNMEFLAELRRRRGDRLQAFNEYRQKRDPTGLFYNSYLRALLEG